MIEPWQKLANRAALGPISRVRDIDEFCNIRGALSDINGLLTDDGFISCMCNICGKEPMRMTVIESGGELQVEVIGQDTTIGFEEIPVCAACINRTSVRKIAVEEAHSHVYIAPEYVLELK